jgi:hypothetical protein
VSPVTKISTSRLCASRRFDRFARDRRSSQIAQAPGHVRKGVAALAQGAARAARAADRGIVAGPERFLADARIALLFRTRNTNRRPSW